jgi:methyl-accepting chemotaxis protein
MFDDRVALLRAIVQSTISIAQSLEDRVIARTLTREQALAMLREDVHALRFNDGMGYAYAQTLDNIIVLHGAAPALEGKPLPPPYKNTTPLTELIRDTLRNSNGGIVSYVFLRPVQTEPVQKVTYVERFTPWGLVFGAGDYVDDLDAAFHAAVLKFGLFGGAIFAVATFTAWLVNRDIAISLGALKAAMERLAKGDLTTVIPATEKRDEFGFMAGAILVFKEHMVQEKNLATAREEDNRRSAAEKQAALIGMADTIEAETTTALLEVAARTNAMTATAEEMSASAARTGIQPTTQRSRRRRHWPPRRRWQALPNNSASRSARLVSRWQSPAK